MKINNNSPKYNIILFLSGFLIYGFMGYFISKYFERDSNHLKYAIFFGVLVGLGEVFVLERIRQYFTK